MGILDRLVGMGKTELGIEEYAVLWRSAVGSILPVDVILQNSGLDKVAQRLVQFDIHHFVEEWEETQELEGISAYRNHMLTNWNEMQNRLKTFKSSQLSDVHYHTIKALQAYGEIMVSYIDFKVMEVEWNRNKASSLEEAMLKKSKDGTQWDILTQEAVEAVIHSLQKLEQQNRTLCLKLTGGKEIGNVFHTPLHSQVRPELFLDGIYGTRPGFIANFTWV